MVLEDGEGAADSQEDCELLVEIDTEEEKEVEEEITFVYEVVKRM